MLFFLRFVFDMLKQDSLIKVFDPDLFPFFKL